MKKINPADILLKMIEAQLEQIDALANKLHADSDDLPEEMSQELLKLANQLGRILK